jgi:hypothetical protein
MTMPGGRTERLLAALALAAALGGLGGASPPPAAADGGPDGGPGPGGGALEEAAKAKALFDDAVAAQGRREYARARKKFKQLLEQFPGADAKLREEADERSADNCFLGMELIHDGGPSGNRVDVELMGDGYLLEKQDQFRKHAEQQTRAFWAEPLYGEYESYFNVWRFDLASKEEGVDDPGAGSRDEAPPDPTKRGKKGPRGHHEYSTALNCQAAGPQRQVWADPDMVFKWRKYLKASDGLSLCFAKKGELGMGGMGIATTGRLVAVVHEFGHAFAGLLDEYANHPGPPPGRIVAPNAVSGRGPKEPPPPAEVPWKHWLAAKNPEVGLFLGGATYTEGVWRPATACAMNSGGSSPYCWVCREQALLSIYDYVSPLDEASPAEGVVRVPPGGKQEFSVVPMAPKSHRLSTDWWLERVKTRVTTRDEDGEPVEAAPEPEPEAPREVQVPQLTPDGFSRGPVRGFLRRRDPWPPGPPRGEPWKSTERAATGGAYRSTATIEGLPAGRYRLTAQVKDDARVPGQRFPWVLRDPYKLLEERREWIVVVGEPAAAPSK